MLSIADLIRILRKHLLTAIAAAFLAAVCTFIGVRLLREYQCTLNFKYNYEGAEKELAPDGVSRLDPYEMQNPAVIHAALKEMGLTTGGETTIEKIRKGMQINKIVTSQDQEVAESAAVLGEKYTFTTTEYQLVFSYKGFLGTDYGMMICDGLIHAYDDYLIDKYYNKTSIPDFMSNLDDMNVDYMDLADIIDAALTDAINTLSDYADWYPDFRSKRTGYSFSELAALYSNVQKNLSAKVKGNIHAGNLTRDKELAIKGYTTMVKDLQMSEETNQAIADSYRSQIKTFYDSYKNAGLYSQASTTQAAQGYSNNRDGEVLRDYDYRFDKLINTYDDIVLSYTRTATTASFARRDRMYYEGLINRLRQDSVSEEDKARLLAKNEAFLATMAQMTSEYCAAANATIDELFDQRVAGDVQYLISTDVSASIPTFLSMLFAAIATGALVMMFALFLEIVRKSEQANPDGASARTLAPNDKEHEAAYQQYKQGFPEFYIVYQQMHATHAGLPPRYEAYVRWNSAELGEVAPGQILRYFGDMNLIMELNDWIVGTVCHDLPRFAKELGVLPVIHINCMFSEVADFGMNSILRKHCREANVAPYQLCVEMDGGDIMACLEEIVLMEKMGYQICVDHFENKQHEKEILSVFKPDCVKLSGAIFAAGESDDPVVTLANTLEYLRQVHARCESNGINLCVSGIENETQYGLANSTLVDYRQGFMLSRPERLEQVLRESSRA